MKNPDLTGTRNGRLVVLFRANKGIAWWHCKCDCGNEIDLLASRFFRYKSCGCLEKENKETIGSRTRTHGMTDTKLYSIWCGIKNRCFNKNLEHYDRYGGRGISICEEWKNSFEAFRDWAYSAGYDDNLSGKEQSIDRIDVNGNYCPENCRWANHKTQMRNTEKSWMIEVNGANIPIRQFCEDNNISYPHFVKRHLDKGASPNEIVRIWNFNRGNHDGYFSITEASDYYHVGKQMVKIWIDKGVLNGEKVGNSWYIPKGQNVRRSEYRDEHGRIKPGCSYYVRNKQE